MVITEKFRMNLCNTLHLKFAVTDFCSFKKCFRTFEINRNRIRQISIQRMYLKILPTILSYPDGKEHPIKTNQGILTDARYVNNIVVKEPTSADLDVINIFSCFVYDSYDCF